MLPFSDARTGNSDISGHTPAISRIAECFQRKSLGDIVNIPIDEMPPSKLLVSHKQNIRSLLWFG